MKKYYFIIIIFLGFVCASQTLNAQTTAYYLTLADNAYANGKLDSSLYYSVMAEPLIKADSGENSHAYARFADQYMGIINEDMGNYTESKAWHEKSLNIYRAINWMKLKDGNYGEALINTGNVYNTLGAYTEAEELFTAAVEIYKDTTVESTGKAYAVALNGLGISYNSMGENTKAGFIFTELLGIMKASFGNEENEPCAVINNNLSAVYQKLGQYDKSIESCKKAVSFFNHAGAAFQKKYEGTLILLGTLYIQKGEADSANVYYAKAMALAKDINDNYYTAAIDALLAKIEEDRNNYKQAEYLYLQALQSSLKIDSLPTNSYYVASNSLASLYYKTGAYAKADSLYSLLLYQANHVKSTEHKLNDQLHYGHSANLFAQNKTSIAADSLQSLNNRTFAFVEQNFKGMNEDEKLDFITMLYKNFDLQYTFLASSKMLSPSFIDAAYKNELMLKGIVRSSQETLLKKITSSGDVKLKDIYQKWLLNKQLLYKQYTLDASARTINVDSLEQQTQAFEKEMSRFFSEEENPFSQTAIGVKEVAEKLKPDETAIEFVRFNFIRSKQQKDSTVYGAFIVRHESAVPEFVTLCSEHELLKLMQNKTGEMLTPNEMVNAMYPQSIGGNIPATKINMRLWQLIWQPLMPYLKRHTTIYYSSAGLLNNISLNAISNAGKGLLTDQYNLYQLFSTANLITKKDIENISASTTISLWGNIDYDVNDSVAYSDSTLTSYSALPDDVADAAKTKGGLSDQWPSLGSEESQSLKNIFDSTKTPFKAFEKSSATEDNFKYYINGFQGVVHVSTHGFYVPEKIKTQPSYAGNIFIKNANPLFRCGLIFSGANKVWQGRVPTAGKEDGVLTAYEISQLDLSKVKLITLSACETGLGEIKGYEGVFGLQRAFKMAGAQTMMVSLWQVPAKQTTELMNGFYTKWLGGKSMHDALLQTQKDMRKKYPPYYWAGFVLIE